MGSKQTAFSPLSQNNYPRPRAMVHLHRHSFELVRVGGRPTAGVIKDVVMLGGFQEVEFDFVADNPGPTLFYCHQHDERDRQKARRTAVPLSLWVMARVKLSLASPEGSRKFRIADAALRASGTDDVL